MAESTNRTMSISYEPSHRSSEGSFNAELNTSFFVDTRQLIEMLQCSGHDNEEADDSKEIDCVDLGTRFENAVPRPKIGLSDVAGSSYQAPGERVSFASGGWMFSKLLPSSVSAGTRNTPTKMYMRSPVHHRGCPPSYSTVRIASRTLS